MAFWNLDFYAPKTIADKTKHFQISRWLKKAKTDTRKQFSSYAESLYAKYKADYDAITSENVPPFLRQRYYELVIAYETYQLKLFRGALKYCSRESLESHQKYLLNYYQECGFSDSSIRIIVENIMSKTSFRPECVFDEISKKWEIIIPESNVIDPNFVVLGCDFTKSDIEWLLRHDLKNVFKNEPESYGIQRSMAPFIKNMMIHSMLLQDWSSRSISDSINKIFDEGTKGTDTNAINSLKNESIERYGKQTKFIEPELRNIAKRHVDYFDLVKKDDKSGSYKELTLTFDSDSTSQNFGFHISY